MEGMQKTKASSEFAPEGDKEWAEYFTYALDGRYAMKPWNACPTFLGGTSAYNWTDPQPRMRMHIGLAKVKGIIGALKAMLDEMPPGEERRSHAKYAYHNDFDDDKAPKHLYIYGGWNDWEADYDHNGAAVDEYRIEEAVHWQEQLGATIGLCTELETLTLQNMMWYVHKDKEGVQQFFVNLRSCEKLGKLALVNNNCGGCFLDAIIPQVVQMPLRVLDLTGNRLYREDRFSDDEEDRARTTAFVHLLATLGECKTLQSLFLADMNLCFMTRKGYAQATQCVLGLMKELPVLEVLKLSDNQMTSEAQVRLEQRKPAMLQITF